MVGLSEAKDHLRVDHDDDDLLIDRCIQAAVNHLESIDVDMSGEPLPAALHQAILLLVGHFYENRSATSAEQLRYIPVGVDRLIAPFRGVCL